MTWKRTLELLRRSLYGKRDAPSEPTPVGLPAGPILRETDAKPNELRTPDGDFVSIVDGLIRIAEDRLNGRSITTSAGGWFIGWDMWEKGKGRLPTVTNSAWLEGPPKLLFRQYAIEHIFDNKILPRGDAADRIDVRTFAGTLQCIDMHGWYYFSEPLSRLAPIIVRGNDITRHFLVPDADSV